MKKIKSDKSIKSKSTKADASSASAKRVSPDDDLNEMRRKYEAMKRRSEGGGASEGGASMWDTLQVGKNLRRILPRGRGLPFFVDSRQHFRIGPDQRATVRCIADAAHFDDGGMPKPGTPCPLCQRFLKEQARINATFRRGDEEGRNEWRKAKEAWCPRTRSLMNVLTPEGEVKVLGAGPMILEKLLTYYYEADGEIGDFTDLESGRSMNIKRTGKGAGDRMTKYDVRPSMESEDISDQWEAIQSQLHDLDKAAGEKLSATAIVALLKGESLEDEDAEEEEEDEEDEDHDQEDEDEDEDEDE